MRWVVLVLLAAATACTKPAQCPATSAAAAGPPFLWRAHKGGHVVWLFGTIHAAGEDAIPRAALDALAASPRLVTELGTEPLDPDVARRHARIASGPGLDHQLPTDDWYDLRDALRGAIKEDDLRRAAPWYAMSLLTKQAGGTSSPGMDRVIVDRAEARGLPVEALESWDVQLKMLGSIVGIADLQEALHARASISCDLERMRAAYMAGDTPTMTALLVVPRTAELMLYARNRAWLPRIESYVTGGGAFMAVGLGHLLGDQGIPALLAKSGYTVERHATR